uniref:Fatty acyl-CoA reductase n=2 Tax=Cacopsylla melanoneura TaxID=428564 RepID=A0A8D8YLP1_9HEMI
MDDPIGKAFKMNIRATQCVLDMFEKMPNKKSFSYISTAYAHAHRTQINERFYPTTMDASELKSLVNSIGDYELACLSPVLTGAYSNSYSFSKALAEEVCRTYVNKGLPVTVVRPSIVVSTYREPLKNWINNVYGATGVLFGASMGFLHVFFADPDAKADLIPVDLVANAVLASMWEVSERSPSPTPVNHDQDSPNVYNLVSSPQNPVTWNDYKVYNERAPEQFTIASSKSIYYYSFGLTKNPFWFHTRVLLTHVLPAIFVDMLLRLKSKKPMMLKAHRKVTNFLKHFHMYAEKDWVYANQNVQRMWSKLSPEDQRLFLFNIDHLDWTWYYNHFIRGIQSYILNEKFDKEGDREKATKHTARLLLVHRIIKYGGTSILTFLLSYLVWWIFLS